MPPLLIRNFSNNYDSIFFVLIYSSNATALLSFLSFAPYNKVTAFSAVVFVISLKKLFLLLSSLKYLFLNSVHFCGSWANHFLNVSLGAISFSQR